LHLDDQLRNINLSTPLLGSVPELDAIAVVNIITALEDNFGFTVEDDEISADCFESFGSLVAFVEMKLSG
jgi:acyl carrier protein